MRVSVMLHLPAPGHHASDRQRSFAVCKRSAWPSGDCTAKVRRPWATFTQISNQITLGRSEEELIKQVGDVVPVLIDYERRARTFDPARARTTCTIVSVGRMEFSARPRPSAAKKRCTLLSSVRMGVNLGLIHDLEIPTINQLFIQHTAGPSAEDPGVPSWIRLTGTSNAPIICNGTCANATFPTKPRIIS